MADAPVHSLYIFINMYTPLTSNADVPVRRLQLDPVTGKLTLAPKKILFLRGPIPLEWLSRATVLSGKTLNVAIALWWLHGMSNGKPFKLTRIALKYLSVGRDAASDGLVRLEQAGLIHVERKKGQRPVISIVLSA